MTHISDNDMNTARAPRYETPTFDARGAFAWTLRAGEIARLEARQERNELSDPKELSVLAVR